MGDGDLKDLTGIGKQGTEVLPMCVVIVICGSGIQIAVEIRWRDFVYGWIF
jgi:hypothetical protein